MLSRAVIRMSIPTEAEPRDNRAGTHGTTKMLPRERSGQAEGKTGAKSLRHTLARNSRSQPRKRIVSVGML